MRYLRQLIASPFLLLLAAVPIPAQGVGKPDPSLSKIEVENDQIRVLRVTLQPHQKSPMHSHPALCGVTLTANNLRVYLPDGSSRESHRSPGEFFWIEPVTHAVENLSDEPMENIEIEFKQSKGQAVPASTTVAKPSAQGTETDPVPVEQEPHHRLVFANQYVRILDVVLQPGEVALFHTHSLDNVPVQLNDTRMKAQFVGQEWKESDVKKGSVGITSGTKTPYAHRVANIGDALFHVYDIQIVP